MAGNNLAVRITADVTDMQVKFALAKAEVSGLTAEMNKLARASVNGGLDSAAQSRLQQVAGDMLAAKTQAAGLATELAQAGVASGAMSGATREMHGSISTATREFRALFDELSSGRTRMTPGTLAIIAQRVLGLSGATLGAVAGVAAFAGGLIYLAYQAAEASKAIDKLHTSSLEAGNDISRLQFQNLTEALSTLPGISASASREIVAAFAGLHMPIDAFTAAARIASEQMRVTGQDAKQVGDAMAKALDPNRKAVDVAKDIAGLTQAQVDDAKAADASGNANAVLTEKLSLLSLQLGRARPATQEYTRSWGQALQDFMSKIGLANAGLDANKTIANDTAAAWQKNAAAINSSVSALKALPSVKPLNYSEKDVAVVKEIEEAQREAVADRHRIIMEEFEQNSEMLQALVAADDRAEQQRTQAAIDGARVRLANAHQMVVETEQLLKGELDREKEMDRQRQEQYGAMVRGIESAETGLIHSLISGRQTFATVARNFAERLAENEIAAAAKSITTRLLLQKSAASQEHAIAAATGSKTVLQDAAKAFSGTYSSVAQIPYVGWILAPAAASAAYAAVAAYEGLASLDVGTLNVPQDMPAMLHQGETVLPKPFAEEFRRTGSVGGGGGDTHNNYGGIGTLNVGYPGIHEMLQRPAGTRSVLQAAAAAYGRGWRG